jgi:rod shape determining protein RodA
VSKPFIAYIKNIDWPLFGSALLICMAGLTTMNSFVGKNIFFNHQLIWLSVAIIFFFIAASMDWRFLKDTRVIMILYGISVGLLTLLFLLGKVSHGAQSWFSFGGFAFQPVDLSELVAIIVLAKYFSRRHVEIAHVRHILVSGLYIMIIFLLVFLQPDFGAAMIIFLLWLGMVLVSGISKKHLLVVFVAGIAVFFVLWGLVFKQYQKDRILNFIHPLTNIRGSGYNAYQSTIAVGSGQIFGKGIGYGTQSRLQYLPEYQTDFVFAAFAEEWGFFGVVLLFILFSIVFTRILSISSKAGSNFETLFGYGVAILLMVHAAINIGTNIGLLPVTGNTLPFMSYGGSHLVTEFLALGILIGMKKYGRAVGKIAVSNEIVGVH